MIDIPTRTALVRVPAFRIDDRGRVTHKAECPFCRNMAIDCDDMAAGCCHMKELLIEDTGSAHFLFERA